MSFGNFNLERRLDGLYFNYVMSCVSLAVSFFMLIYLVATRRNPVGLTNGIMWLFAVGGFIVWSLGLIIIALDTNLLGNRVIQSNSNYFRLFQSLKKRDQVAAQLHFEQNGGDSSYLTSRSINAVMGRNNNQHSVTSASPEENRKLANNLILARNHYNHGGHNAFIQNINDCNMNFHNQPACYLINWDASQNIKSCLRFNNLCELRKESNYWQNYFLLEQNKLSMKNAMFYDSTHHSNLIFGPNNYSPAYFSQPLYSLSGQNGITANNVNQYTFMNYLSNQYKQFNSFDQSLGLYASTCNNCPFCGPSGGNCDDWRQPRLYNSHPGGGSGHNQQTIIHVENAGTVIMQDNQHSQNTNVNNQGTGNANMAEISQNNAQQNLPASSLAGGSSLLLNQCKISDINHLNCDTIGADFRNCENACNIQTSNLIPFSNSFYSQYNINYDYSLHQNQKLYAINNCINQCFRQFIASTNNFGNSGSSISKEFCFVRQNSNNVGGLFGLSGVNSNVDWFEGF